MMRYYRLLAVVLPLCAGCVVISKQIDPTSELAEARVRPGITILLGDSIQLIRGKRIGLLTNQTGINENGTSDIDLLRDKKARDAAVSLVQLFSPEHGLRGTEDRTNIASGIDQKSGLPVYSLYGQQTMAPPDSLLGNLDAIEGQARRRVVTCTRGQASFSCVNNAGSWAEVKSRSICVNGAARSRQMSSMTRRASG